LDPVEVIEHIHTVDVAELDMVTLQMPFLIHEVEERFEAITIRTYCMVTNTYLVRQVFREEYGQIVSEVFFSFHCQIVLGISLLLILFVFSLYRDTSLRLNARRSRYP